MGIAKSLRKANHLGGVGDNLSQIGQILEANRQKKEREQLYSTVTGLIDKWKQGQEEAKMPVALKEGGRVSNPFSPENFRSPISGEKPTGMNLKIPENVQQIQGDMLPVAPQTQTREIPASERYQKGQENLSELMTSVMQVLTHPNADNELLSKVNVLSGLAQRETDMMKPKERKVGTYNPEHDVVFEDTGEVIRQGRQKKDTNKVKEYEMSEDGSHKIYEIAGQKYMNLIEKDAEGNQIGTKLERIPAKGEGKTTVNIKQPEDKRLKETTAKLIADLKNFKPYTINTEGEKVPMSAEDVKYEKDKTLENIKLQLLSPRAYEFINNIEMLWREGDKTGSKQYLSPKEIYNEAVKHAESENIPEEVQDEIANYLKYYSEDIYNGLTTQP